MSSDDSEHGAHRAAASVREALGLAKRGNEAPAAYLELLREAVEMSRAAERVTDQ